MIISEWPMALKNELSINRKMKWLIISIFAMFMAVGAVSATDGYFAFDTSGYFNKVSDIRNPSGTILNLTGDLKYGGVNVCLADGSVLQDKINNIYFVNQISSLQTTINNCPSEGCIIYINNGTHYVTSTVNTKSNIKIKGMGIDNTIIKRSSNDDYNIFEIRDKTNVEISDLTIDSQLNGTNIYGTNNSNIKINNIKLLNAKSRQFFISYSDKISFNNNIVDGTIGNEVIQFSFSENYIVENNFFANNNAEWTIYNYNSSKGIISNNIITNTSHNIEGFGIAVYTGGDDILISNNIINSVGTKAISIQPSIPASSTPKGNNIRIIGNIINGTTERAILIADTNNAIISQNKITNANGRGIWTIRTPNIIISENTISETNSTYGHGIQIESSNNTIITNNIVKNLKQSLSDGINIYDSYYGIINNNNIYNVTRSSIHEDLGSDYNIIMGNTYDGTFSSSSSFSRIILNNFGNINTNNQWISGDGDDEGLKILDNGYVGVGVSPSNRLHIGSGNLKLDAGEITVDNGGGWQTKIIGNELRLGRPGGNYITATDGGSISFRTNGTTDIEGAITIEGYLQWNKLNTGSNAGTDLCVDSINRLCKCGTCS